MSLKSFFSAIVAEAKTMWKKAPALEVAAASTINALIPEVELLDVILLPEEAQVLNPILDKVKNGLTALKVTIQGTGNPSNITSIVASINANMDTLASAAQIKDPASLAKVKEIAAIVSSAISEFTPSIAATPVNG